MATEFHLTVKVEIEKREIEGGHWRSTGDRFGTHEEFQIPARSFTEIAEVLGKFNDLAERIRAGRESHSETSA